MSDARYYSTPVLWTGGTLTGRYTEVPYAGEGSEWGVFEKSHNTKTLKSIHETREDAEAEVNELKLRDHFR